MPNKRIPIISIHSEFPCKVDDIEGFVECSKEQSKLLALGAITLQPNHILITSQEVVSFSMISKKNIPLGELSTNIEQLIHTKREFRNMYLYGLLCALRDHDRDILTTQNAIISLFDRGDKYGK
jgi:hypothetical protein